MWTADVSYAHVTGLYVCHSVAMFYNRGLLEAEMRADF